MLKSNKLRARIIERGYNYETLAPVIGISLTSLSNKMRGRRDFTAREIQKLRDVLDIGADEVCDIFFANNVD